MARQADLLSVAEAQDRIGARFGRLDRELVGLAGARGRILASDLVAARDLPPFTNSSMDGFAVVAAATKSASAEAPVRLRVSGTIAAGSFSSSPVQGSDSVRIMTGAPLPPGADAVIPFEDVEDLGGEIVLRSPVAPAASVRASGQDIRRGEIGLTAGMELAAPQIALAAALGVDPVPVVRRPAVAVLSTGDELVPPGQPLGPGQIYNSNIFMLGAAIEEAGGVPRILETVGDDTASIASAFAQAAGCDLLITSGGASVGDFDYVKDVIGASGEVGFWRVRVRPGKPLLFGSIGSLPIVGLPGNPTSAMVTFELFVLPAIRTMLGLPAARAQLEVVIDDRIDNRGGRETYARVRLRQEDGRLHASPAGPQDSAMLNPLAHCDALVRIPADRESAEPGDRLPATVWRLPA